MAVLLVEVVTFDDALIDLFDGEVEGVVFGDLVEDFYELLGDEFEADLEMLLWITIATRLRLVQVVLLGLRQLTSEGTLRCRPGILLFVHIGKAYSLIHITHPLHIKIVI